MPPMTLRKILVLAASAAGVLYAGFLCLLYFSQGSIIYPGAKNRVDTIPPPSPGAELSRISTALGNVDALLGCTFAGMVVRIQGGFLSGAMRFHFY